MTHALVLAGHGRYEDPWHDGAAIAHRVAQLLADDGIDTTIRGTLPDALDDIEPDLVVVASGRGRPDADFDGTDEDWAAVPRAARSARRLRRPRARAAPGDQHVPRLAVVGSAARRPVDRGHHLAPAARRRDVPGGRRRTTRSAPAWPRSTAEDEQYLVARGVAATCRCSSSPTTTGTAHPVVWVAPGPGRVVYDALGHDVRSYDSPSRVELFRREVRWLLSR